MSEPGYCAQFYPTANCNNKGPGNPLHRSELASRRRRLGRSPGAELDRWRCTEATTQASVAIIKDRRWPASARREHLGVAGVNSYSPMLSPHTGEITSAATQRLAALVRQHPHSGPLMLRSDSNAALHQNGHRTEVGP
jgi:hypothetical protein